jgi:hypothetical protein
LESQLFSWGVVNIRIPLLHQLNNQLELHVHHVSYTCYVGAKAWTTYQRLKVIRRVRVDVPGDAQEPQIFDDNLQTRQDSVRRDGQQA